MIAAAAAMPTALVAVPPTAAGAGQATAADFAGLLDAQQCALATADGLPASVDAVISTDAAKTLIPTSAPGPARDATSAVVLASVTSPVADAAAAPETPAPAAQPPRPRPSTSCRAPTPISLRGGEPSELAPVEVALPSLAAEPVAPEASATPTPEDSRSPDPATSLLAQLGLQLAPVPAPPPVKPAVEASGVGAPALTVAGAAAATGPATAPAGEGRVIELTDPAASVETGPPITTGDALSPPSVAAGRGGDPVLAPTSFFALAAGARVEPPALPPVPVNTARADWPEQLSSQIVWQLGQEVQEARIALAPDDLGAIDLQVRVQEGRVQVHMGAAQLATRELLSEALPRLRELLGESGLSLSQASVFSQDPAPRGHPPWSRPHGPDRTDQAPEVPPAVTVRRSRGLLDHYA